MKKSQIEKALDNMILLVDTREQPTQRLQERINAIGFQYERRKLNVGDYSCKVILPAIEPGKTFELDLSGVFAIERKMNLDELAMCFTSERDRFEREFERADRDRTKMYLIVENASWEKLTGHCYRSKMLPKALMASINAFRARYNMQLDFCHESTTGKLMRDILMKEARHFLEAEFYLFGEDKEEHG